MIRGSLANDLRDLRTNDLPRFFDREADAGRRMLQREVRALTPVGRRIDQKTGADLGPSGALRASVTLLPVRRLPGRIVTGVKSDKSYASDVEYGTKAHVIEGNKYLRFWSQGQMRIRRRVNHPGQEAKFMFLLGAEETDRLYEQDANPRLARLLRGSMR